MEVGQIWVFKDKEKFTMQREIQIKYIGEEKVFCQSKSNSHSKKELILDKNYILNNYKKVAECWYDRKVWLNNLFRDIYGRDIYA